MGKTGSKLKLQKEIDQDKDISLLDNTVRISSHFDVTQTTANNTSRPTIKSSTELSKYQIVEVLCPDDRVQKSMGLFGQVAKVLNVVNQKYYALKIIELYEDEISRIPKFVEQDYYKLRNLRSMECLLRLHGYKLDVEKVEVEEGDSDDSLSQSCDIYKIDQKTFNLGVGEIDMSYSKKLMVARNKYLMEQRQKMSLLRIGLDEHGNQIGGLFRSLFR